MRAMTLGTWATPVTFALLFACGDGGGEDADKTTPTDGTSTTTETTPGTTPTTPTTPTTRTTPTECAEDPTLTVVSAIPTAGPMTTQLQVDVALSAAATAAVQCTADDDPTEVFFAESTTPATTHSLRLSGLLPGKSWTCGAAPTCPTAATPATTFTYTTENPPADLRLLDVEEDPVLGLSGPWLLAPYTLNSFGGKPTWLVIWGREGAPRWWYKLPNGVGMWVEALYHTDTKDLVWGGGMAAEGRIRTMDLWDGETWAFAPPGWEQEEFHHDGKRLDDGRMLTLEIRDNVTKKGTHWDGFGLRVTDPATGVVDWEFDSQGLFDAGILPAGTSFNADPWHANWTTYKDTPTGPMAYVSLCFTERILAIDATTSELAWEFGKGLGWTIQDATGAPLPDDAFPQCQHGLEVNGDTFLVYDNGQDRHKSMAEEWQIDGANKTATLLWSWTEAGWSEDYIGDIDYLPNDRVLVTEAAQFGTSVIVEVDRATGDVAGRLTLTEGYTYRSEQYAGCDLFDSVKECPTLATRFDALAPLLR